MTDELTKETIRQEALESWRIGADTGKFYARVINALMHNKIKIEDLPLDLMKGFRMSQKLQLKIGKKMTEDIEEKRSCTWIFWICVRSILMRWVFQILLILLRALLRECAWTVHLMRCRAF